MKEPNKASRVHDLIAVIEEHCALHESLAATMGDLLDCIRRADVGALASKTAVQQDLVRQIRQCEAQRRRLTVGLAGELGLPQGGGRRVTLSQVAGQLAAGDRDALLGAGMRLKRAVDQVARQNRIHQRITSRMLAHVGWILAAVRPPPPAFADYGGDGQKLDAAGAAFFETVG